MLPLVQINMGHGIHLYVFVACASFLHGSIFLALSTTHHLHSSACCVESLQFAQLHAFLLVYFMDLFGFPYA